MHHHLTARPIVIIEDSDEDYEVTGWVLKQSGVINPLFRCKNSKEIDSLFKDRTDWPIGLNGPFPLLVLLDLNIPGTSWNQTLDKLRNNFWWKHVPVLILSTSNQPEVISVCYGEGAAGYLKKPVELNDFLIIGQIIFEYWLNTVIPPLPPIENVTS
jgi:CheY-like chemotaxis protein